MFEFAWNACRGLSFCLVEEWGTVWWDVDHTWIAQKAHNTYIKDGFLKAQMLGFVTFTWWKKTRAMRNSLIRLPWTTSLPYANTRSWTWFKVSVLLIHCPGHNMLDAVENPGSYTDFWKGMCEFQGFYKQVQILRKFCCFFIKLTNYMWSIHGIWGMKVCSNGTGHVTKMATPMIYDKSLQNSSEADSQWHVYQYYNGHEIWYTIERSDTYFKMVSKMAAPYYLN